MKIKKYANLAFAYAVVAMVLGVFYREFTKIAGFTGKTNLSVMHTHYFVLGMGFFLLLVLFEKAFVLSRQEKRTKWLLIFYNIGLNITGLCLLVRGALQVLGTPIGKGINAGISGIAGVGHILLGTGIILFLVTLKKQLQTTEE